MKKSKKSGASSPKVKVTPAAPPELVLHLREVLFLLRNVNMAENASVTYWSEHHARKDNTRLDASRMKSASMVALIWYNADKYNDLPNSIDRLLKPFEDRGFECRWQKYPGTKAKDRGFAVRLTITFQCTALEHDMIIECVDKLRWDFFSFSHPYLSLIVEKS